MATLAACAPGAVVEFGTGAGVGIAWMRHGAPASTRVVTVEPDEQLAEHARTTFADDDIEIICGTWEECQRIDNIGMLHVSLRNLDGLDRDEIAALLPSGAILVIDDFIPSQEWPPHDFYGVDYVRQTWLLDKRFTAVDVAVAADVSAVIAVKR